MNWNTLFAVLAVIAIAVSAASLPMQLVTPLILIVVSAFYLLSLAFPKP